MIDEMADWVERVRRAFGDGCFACGRDNPEGLHLHDWDWSGAESTAMFRPRPTHIGADTTLHGGLAATVLDEAMVWAGIFAERVLTVTATMQLRFRRPLSVHDAIEARGRVVSRSGRRLQLAGSLHQHGRPCVEATGLYVVSQRVE